MKDIHASVWSSDGATQLAVLPDRKGVNWQDILNAAGTGGISVPADDPAAAHLLDRNIVKFWYAPANRYVYAFRIKTPTQVVVGDTDADRWVTASGPGVMDLLNDAVLYPEYGLSRNSLDERAFTFASAAGDWYVSSEWGAPIGVVWTSEATSRANDPADWKDPTAYWIWVTDPEVDSPDLDVVYFRASFTLAADSMVSIQATADNYFDLYLDGQLILSSGTTDPLTWTRTNTYPAALPAGTYLLAARCTNAKKAWSTQANPAAFLCTVYNADSKGNPTTVVLHTDTTNWLCRDEGTDPPGWRAAQVLHTFITEAQARSVPAVSALTVDFTTTADSNGTTWTDLVDRTFTVGTKGVDLVEQLSELSIDIAVGPDMVVHAWTQRGTDKSTGANPVVVRPGRNVTAYDLDHELAITTRLLVRTPTGWVEVAASNEATDGRVEDMLSLGNAASDAQATRQAQAAFDNIAVPVTTFKATCLPVAGATPYADFDLGDTVLAPDGSSGTVALRVMSLSVKEDDTTGDVTFVPELYKA